MTNNPFISLAFVTITLAAGSALAASGQVKTDTGKLKGITTGGVTSFKGIPYAAPPVGDLRWRPPQAVTPWAGVRQASEYGADCMQLPFPGDAAPLGVKPAEDCLYVNVWVPAAKPAKKLPVMMWIYGGGYVNGGSSPAVYDGSQFARRGVVFVSFNYRVGRFGFFAFPALSKENPAEPHGNYTFMDQIAALKWVRRNIAAFGGDPGNVTLFGESAGGGSVLTMLTSPLAKGLFQKAVIESGGGRTGLMPVHSIPQAESIGVAFAKKAGVTGDDAAALAALRKLPADAVVDRLNMASMFAAQATYAGPMIDGKVVVETPEAAYAAGHGAKIPLIIGANSMDIGFNRAKTMDELLKPFGPDRDKARAAFDPAGTGSVNAAGTMVSAIQIMVEPARFMARTLASLGQPVYEYRFSYVAESMRKQWKGAPHATEIPFVFDTVQARYGKDLAPADKATAEAANAYWVNFAKSANPNGAGLPEWPAYKADTDLLLDFAEKGPAAGPDPWKERIDLVEAMVTRGK
ncbi:MAG: carboxylesterase family protein [Bryobacteraceae bacterium]|jgi:para-nitrobenzyl esterase